MENITNEEHIRIAKYLSEVKSALVDVEKILGTVDGIQPVYQFIDLLRHDLDQSFKLNGEGYDPGYYAYGVVRDDDIYDDIYIAADNLIKVIERDKPKDRSDRARMFAISHTEAQKLLAFIKVYCIG